MLLPIDTIAALIYLSFYVLAGNPIFTASPTVSQDHLILTTFAHLAIAAIVSFGVSVICTASIKRRKSNLSHRGISAYAEIITRGYIVFTYIWLTETTSWPFNMAKYIGLPKQDYILYLLGITPYLVLCGISWLAQYRLHCTIMPGNWTRMSHFIHKARYSLFILGLWLPLITLGGIADYSIGNTNDPAFTKFLHTLNIDIKMFSNILHITLFAITILGIWAFPRFLLFFWGCKKLTDEKILSRIKALQDKAGVKFSGIYVWDLGGGQIINAAAVGFAPPFRYLFLSSALIEKLKPDEIDAVVCHEMGHIRHHHIIYYGGLTIATMSIIQHYLEQMPVGVTVLGTIFCFAMYIRFGFAYFSRRFERQADLFSTKILGSGTPLRHALEKIGQYYNNMRLTHSWHHQSICERCRFLAFNDFDRSLGVTHHYQVKRVRFIGYAVMLAAIWLLSNSLNAPTPQTMVRPSKQMIDAHDRRLSEITPAQKIK